MQLLKSFTHTKMPRITHDYLSGAPVQLVVMKVATIILDIAEPCLSDYTKFVMKIPCMDLLYAIHAVKDNNISSVPNDDIGCVR